jgi:hypothetical protein
MDSAPDPSSTLADDLLAFRREDAERFIGKVRGDDPELAAHLRIEVNRFRIRGARAAHIAGHWRLSSAARMVPCPVPQPRA